MAMIYTENFLISLHTLVSKKSNIKKILTQSQLEEISALLENYIKNLPNELNGVVVEIEPVENE